MIEIEHLIKRYPGPTGDITVLDELDLSVAKGESVAIVGPSGCGKSTLLRLLSGIYEPTRGVAAVRGRVAPVFDLGVGMDPEISGFENIIIRGLFLGQTRKQMLAKVDEIAEFTIGVVKYPPALHTFQAEMRFFTFRDPVGVPRSNAAPCPFHRQHGFHQYDHVAWSECRGV